MSNTNFVHHYPFSSPLQRLIMIRILMEGSLDGEGERVLGPVLGYTITPTTGDAK